MMAVVSTDTGPVKGEQSASALHFRGIPYAAAERFGPPEQPPCWQDVRDASRDAPVCPQLPSALETVMGANATLAQDEDCLTLTVSTPGIDDRRRPVMVWLHGGAYVVGAGSYPWYRGDTLASEGDVVVVNVNYRLGVFGYLQMEGISPGNLGLMDQIAALHWVQRNIAAFGGDPQQVTLFGQSAGGHSVAALMSTAATDGLFHRAIVQSAHLGVGFTSPITAKRVARLFERGLRGADPRSASVEQLLSAQGHLLQTMARPAGLNSVPPFGPIAGQSPLPALSRRQYATHATHQRTPLLIGTTSEEMRAFFDPNPVLSALRRIPAIGTWLLAGLSAAVTRRVFARPAQQLADLRAGSDADVYLYRFDWTPRGGFGACHTIELPALFGNAHAWGGAPMLGDASGEDLDRVGRDMRRAFSHFARDGDPNAEGDPRWPKHRAGAKPGRCFR